MRKALRVFIDGLLHGTKFPITPGDGLHVVTRAEACSRAANTGQAVAVE